jgi:hypothetical protein
MTSEKLPNVPRATIEKILCGAVFLRQKRHPEESRITAAEVAVSVAVDEFGWPKDKVPTPERLAAMEWKVAKG